jgi:hypothetical protein
MSRQLALDIINLKPTGQVGHTEYSLEYHPEYAAARLGLAQDDPGLWRALYDDWGIDFCWSTDDGLHGNWGARGRCTDMGHAAYAGDGSDLHQPATCPFTSPEEVWAFDPVAEYGLPHFDEQVAAYQRGVTAALQSRPNQLVTGGYYKTIVSGGIQAFGWDMLLEAAADRKRMEAAWDRFFRFTLHHMKAWAQTSVEVIIQHDDFVWSAGAFMNPSIYRDIIIPRYAELWKPLHAAGKKVLFCSDGLFDMFVEDLAEAGADGFIFEPCNRFGAMAERVGKSKALVGSCVDCRDLSFGTWETVRETIDETLRIARQCAGVILAVGNHMPSNIPDSMMDRFIEHVKANRVFHD